MDSQVELPTGWTVDEEPELPTGWTVDEGISDQVEKSPSGMERIRQRAEYLRELDKDFSQGVKKGKDYFQTITGNLAKGFISGKTFGLAENIEALKPEEGEPYSLQNIATTAGELAGGYKAISKIHSFFNKPLAKLAQKSPVLTKQLTSLADIGALGLTGMSDAAIRDVFQGEMPTPEDVLKHGAEWATLGSIFKAAGYTGGKLAKLFTPFGAVKPTKIDRVNGLSEFIKEKGLNLEDIEIDAKAGGRDVDVLLNEYIESLQSQYNKSVSKLKEPVEIEIQPVEPQPKPIKAEVPEPVIPEPPEVPQQSTQLSQGPSQNKYTKAALEALEQPKITPESIQSHKVNEQSLRKLENGIPALVSPYKPGEFDFSSESKALETTSVDELINTVAPPAESPEHFGIDIRKAVDSEYEKAKQVYKDHYKPVDDAAPYIITDTKNASNYISEASRKLSRIKTGSSSYKLVSKALATSAEDLGYKVDLNEDGTIDEIFKLNATPLSYAIELSHRLNEMVNFEKLDKDVKNVLSVLASSVKRDIEETLNDFPKLKESYNAGEKEFAEVQKRFGKDTVRKIRTEESGYTIAKLAESPTGMRELSDILPPESMKQVERYFLDNLNTRNYGTSKSNLANVEHQLSEQSREVAKTIVQSKNPHNPQTRLKLEKEAILDEVSNALNLGQRPTKTLNLWKTPQGQKLVRDTFKNGPNAQTVIKYLQKQSFGDMVESIMKDGYINRKLATELIKDPAMIHNIRDLGGEEAVRFFRTLGSKLDRIEKSINQINKIYTGKEINELNRFVERKHLLGEDVIKRKKQANEDSIAAIEEHNRTELKKAHDAYEEVVAKIKKDYKAAKDKANEEYKAAVSQKKELDQKAREEAKQSHKDAVAKEKKERLAKLQKLKEEMERITKQIEEFKKQRLRDAQSPISQKYQALEEWLKEALHLGSNGATTAKAALTVFGFMKLGVPHATALLVGAKIFNKLLTSKKGRELLIKASEEGISTPEALITFISAISKLLQEETQE